MKVSIVGVGRVGAAVGLALVAAQTADEIVLVGRDLVKAEAEALDLQHAAVFGRMTRVSAGPVEATAGSDVVVLALGVPQTGTSRNTVAAGNAALFAEVVPALAAASPDAVLVVATNPTEVMTTVAIRLAGLPDGRVVGTGTLLDTMRLRDAIGRRIGVRPADVRVYVLGEHGEAQFAAFSSGSVGGAPLRLSADEQRQLEAGARDGGVRIFSGKGHTSHGIALATAAVVGAVAHDSREVLPLSVAPHGIGGVDDVCLSLPVVIGRAGVVRRLELDFDEREQAALQQAAASIRAALAAADPRAGTRAV